MKLKISAKLDVRKLDVAIDQYQNTIAYSEDTFLIMNVDTCKALSCDIIHNFRVDIKNAMQYRGINIAIGNMLNFGEVIIK